MNKFDEWYDETSNVDGGIHHSDGLELSKSAWDYQQERINKVITRLEEYPCDMSCYVNTDQRMAAKNMQMSLIDILKEELL